MNLDQELEIEYKNLLTKDEYEKILTNEFLDISKNQDYIRVCQTNHYFDTLEKDLKKQGAAVRIRVSEAKNELTFKVPSQDFLMETNLMLSDSETQRILNKKSFKLSEITSQSIELNISNINTQSLFTLFNTFKTIRFEKKVGSNWLVLDQTFFENKEFDYELEVEGQTSQEAKKYFNSILNTYSILSRPALPKIARAEKNKV